MARISDQLRREIEAAPMTRYRLAQETGVQESTLSRFIRGGTIQLATLDRLADVLGLELAKRKPRR